MEDNADLGVTVALVRRADVSIAVTDHHLPATRETGNGEKHDEDGKKQADWGVRRLRFFAPSPADGCLVSDYVQSEMAYRSFPDGTICFQEHTLCLAYHRLMVFGASLCFHPLSSLSSLLAIGMGAGCVPRFLAHASPRTHFDVVDNDNDVIALAHTHFGLPENIPHVRVVCEDGALFVRRCVSDNAQYDVIMVDAGTEPPCEDEEECGSHGERSEACETRGSIYGEQRCMQSRACAEDDENKKSQKKKKKHCSESPQPDCHSDASQPSCVNTASPTSSPHHHHHHSARASPHILSPLPLSVPPYDMRRKRFLRQCRQLLRLGGVLVMNCIATHRHARAARKFERRVVGVFGQGCVSVISDACAPDSRVIVATTHPVTLAASSLPSRLTEHFLSEHSLASVVRADPLWHMTPRMERVA